VKKIFDFGFSILDFSPAAFQRGDRTLMGRPQSKIRNPKSKIAPEAER
jgi:hypothetical protein